MLRAACASRQPQRTSSGAGESIRINLTDWSPDSRRDEFVAAWTLTAAAPQGRGGRGAAGGADVAPGRGAGRRGSLALARRAVVVMRALRRGSGCGAGRRSDRPRRRGSRQSRSGGTRRCPRRRGRNAAAQTPKLLSAAALKKAPTVGILWTSENVGYSIKYAYRVAATGRRRAHHPCNRSPCRHVEQSCGSPQPADATDYTFSIIELRLNSKGEGEGRGVVTGKIVADGQRGQNYRAR